MPDPLPSTANSSISSLPYFMSTPMPSGPLNQRGLPLPPLRPGFVTLDLNRPGHRWPLEILHQICGQWSRTDNFSSVSLQEEDPCDSSRATLPFQRGDHNTAKEKKPNRKNLSWERKEMWEGQRWRHLAWNDNSAVKDRTSTFKASDFGHLVSKS